MRPTVSSEPSMGSLTIIALPDSSYQRLVELAALRGKTVNEALQEALTAWIEKGGGNGR